MSKGPPRRRPQQVWRPVACWSVALGLIATVLWGLSPRYAIKINGMHSIGGTLFILDKTVRPQQGEIAYFYPPNATLYPEAMAFGKYIAGSPGDVFSVAADKVFINGVYLGKVFAHTRAGAPLRASAPGVIPADHYFMWGEHEHSYDSRYADIGWIHQRRIVGRLHRLF